MEKNIYIINIIKNIASFHNPLKKNVNNSWVFYDWRKFTHILPMFKLLKCLNLSCWPT